MHLCVLENRATSIVEIFRLEVLGLMVWGVLRNSNIDVLESKRLVLLTPPPPQPPPTPLSRRSRSNFIPKALFTEICFKTLPDTTERGCLFKTLLGIAPGMMSTVLGRGWEGYGFSNRISKGES